MPPMPDLVRPGLMNVRNIGAAAVAAAVALAAFFLVRMAFPDEEPAPPPVVEVVQAPAPAPAPEPEPPPPEPVAEPEPEELLPVTLVARRYIAPGVQITADMVEWREWPGAMNHDFALLEGEVPLNNVLGALTKLAIEEDALITWDKIIVPGGAGFLTSMLAPGHRAVTVEVDRATTAANIIRPGDRVDVILTYSGDLVAAGLGPVAQVIARNVLVLAVGSYTIETHPFFAGTIGDTLAKIAETPPPQGDTYTLEVPVQDAERLALASRQITLALRPYGTTDAMRHPRLIGFKDVITTLPEPEQAQAPHSVRVIRGVQRADSVLDAPLPSDAGA